MYDLHLNMLPSVDTAMRQNPFAGAGYLHYSSVACFSEVIVLSQRRC